mmetsp:Transcript_20720/g.63030  ORF Transcript_20720/g.63030 Transcript_20720/m.63030 type:complete len:272 (-) Transcript_20720:350-1165(-)
MTVEKEFMVPSSLSPRKKVESISQGQAVFLVRGHAREHLVPGVSEALPGGRGALDERLRRVAVVGLDDSVGRALLADGLDADGGHILAADTADELIALVQRDALNALKRFLGEPARPHDGVGELRVTLSSIEAAQLVLPLDLVVHDLPEEVRELVGRRIRPRHGAAGDDHEPRDAGVNAGAGSVNNAIVIHGARVVRLLKILLIRRTCGVDDRPGAAHRREQLLVVLHVGRHRGAGRAEVHTIRHLARARTGGHAHTLGYSVGRSGAAGAP